MKVIIIYSNENSHQIKELANNTCEVLNKTKGSITFEIFNEDKFVVKEDIRSHNDIFETCKKFRKYQNVPVDNFVVLLTKRTYNNWFSAFDGQRNIYVHTEEWDRYPNVPAEYSIAYSIAENILQTLMGVSINNLDWAHKEPIACVNDFCGNKRDITRKMQSADVCLECIKRINVANVRKTTLADLLSIFESIRKIFREKKFGFVIDADTLDVENAIYEMHITKSYGVYLIDTDSEKEVKIKLPDAEFALYLFILLNPSGVNSCYLDENQFNFITEIYKRFCKRRAEITRNPFVTLVGYNSSADDKFAQYKSRINKRLRELIDNKDYCIDNTNGCYKIIFDRRLLKCENNIISEIIKIGKQQGLNVGL